VGACYKLDTLPLFLIELSDSGNSLKRNQLPAWCEASFVSAQKKSKNSSIKKIDITDLNITIAPNSKKGAFDILTTRTSVNEEILVPFI